METKKINLNEQPSGKKETEKVNYSSGSVDYSETSKNIEEHSNAASDSQQSHVHKDKNSKGVIGTVAAGIGGAALGGGVAKAANADDEPVEKTDDSAAAQTTDGGSSSSTGTIHEPTPTPDATPTPEPTPEPTPGPTPEPTPTPTTNPTPNPDDPTGAEPAPSPHIEEVLVDPDDIDGEQIMNIEGVGTVDVDGVEYNAAMVTDDAGNAYYLVDVDGEENDPNATFDIIVDAETGEMAGLPTNLSVSDTMLMAENNIAYVNPVAGDSNNVASEDMLADISDPSAPEGTDTVIPSYDPLSNDLECETDVLDDPSLDIIDPLV